VLGEREEGEDMGKGEVKEETSIRPIRGCRGKKKPKRALKRNLCPGELRREGKVDRERRTLTEVRVPTARLGAANL